MKLNKFEFEEVITETSVNTVCALISRADVYELFKKHNATPKNEAMEPDNNYTEGEIQFNYDKEDGSLFEILVFPIYENDDGDIMNGDFLNITDTNDLDEDYIKQADEELKKTLEREQELDI
jgi:hypothetical protein